MRRTVLGLMLGMGMLVAGCGEPAPEWRIVELKDGHFARFNDRAGKVEVLNSVTGVWEAFPKPSS